MPQLTTRQREAIQSLTDRQLEALSCAALGLSPRMRLSAANGARSNMGGAVNRMVDQLKASGLLDADGITFAGVEGVLLNIARVPVINREAVKDAATKVRPKLKTKADQAEAALAAWRKARDERAAARILRREAAIPAKLAELAERFNAEAIEDALGRTSDDKLVALWDAIVNADGAL